VSYDDWERLERAPEPSALTIGPNRRSQESPAEVSGWDSSETSEYYRHEVSKTMSTRTSRENGPNQQAEERRNEHVDDTDEEDRPKRGNVVRVEGRNDLGEEL
jgi:hypothetical protein